MRNFRAISAIIIGLAVAGCSGPDTATRNSPLEMPAVSAPATLPSFDIRDIRVSVPKSLKVSEADRYFPGGDIVWREDPRGDRHAQVKAIFDAGLGQGVQSIGPGLVPAILDVEVKRFHALTEKARYSTGGVHAIQFNMVLRNPETGQAYGAPQFVKADFKAFGGEAAIKAESRGITQKYRIKNQLAQVIATQLTQPGGYQAANLGLMGVLDKLGASNKN